MYARICTSTELTIEFGTPESLIIVNKVQNLDLQCLSPNHTQVMYSFREDSSLSASLAINVDPNLVIRNNTSDLIVEMQNVYSSNKEFNFDMPGTEQDPLNDNCLATSFQPDFETNIFMGSSTESEVTTHQRIISQDPQQAQRADSNESFDTSPKAGSHIICFQLDNRSSFKEANPGLVNPFETTPPLREDLLLSLPPQNFISTYLLKNRGDDGVGVNEHVSETKPVNMDEIGPTGNNIDDFSSSFTAENMRHTSVVLLNSSEFCTEISQQLDFLKEQQEFEESNSVVSNQHSLASPEEECSLASLRIPNNISLHHLKKESKFHYATQNQGYLTTYSPRVYRTPKNNKNGTQGMCPYCVFDCSDVEEQNLLFFGMKDSSYVHHLGKNHGIYADGSVMPDPMFIIPNYAFTEAKRGKKKKSQGSSETKTVIANGAICPNPSCVEGTRHIIPIKVGDQMQGSRSSNKFLAYLRHHYEQHKKDTRVTNKSIAYVKQKMRHQ
ncbi:GQ67_00634T0 [Komagataella phaffii]|nr:GQ67_00634T0 [Komagataella phaffii]AOA67220.1 GQ68_00754T0 [Komagataella phaffii GS115]